MTRVGLMGGRVAVTSSALPLRGPAGGAPVNFFSLFGCWSPAGLVHDAVMPRADHTRGRPYQRGTDADADEGPGMVLTAWQGEGKVRRTGACVVSVLAEGFVVPSPLTIAKLCGPGAKPGFA